VFEKVGNTYGFDVTKLKEVIVRRSSWWAFNFEYSNVSKGAINELLNEIAKVESVGWSIDQQYNSIYRDPGGVYRRYQGRKITDMTLREVLNLQSEFLNSQGWWNKSSAIWRYQFLKSTLQWLINGSGKSLDEKFTPELQDEFATRLAVNRIRLWRWNVNEAVRQLSLEWAWLPKDASWAGSYDWFNGNRAGKWVSAWNIANIVGRIIQENPSLF
jgi:hypothetical protein